MSVCMNTLKMFTKLKIYLTNDRAILLELSKSINTLISNPLNMHFEESEQYRT